MTDKQQQYPVTDLQALWISQYQPERYRRLHLVSCVRCAGRVSPELMSRAVGLVVARHGILRAVVRGDGAGLALQISQQSSIPVRTLNMEGRDLKEVVDAFRIEPFDLEAGPLLRVGIGEIGDESVLVLVVHHVVADGWSLGIIWKEILSACAQYSPDAVAQQESPAPVYQFTEELQRRKAWLSSAAADNARQYWRRRFEGVQKPVVLPRDRRTSEVNPRLLPVSGHLETAESALLVSSARAMGVPISSALLAAFVTLLSIWGRGSDVMTWVCHTGRRRKEAMQAIGCFVDMWLLSVRVGDAMQLQELMVAVHRAVTEALPALGLPASEIGNQAAAMVGDESRPRVVFNYLPAPPESSSRATQGAFPRAEPVSVALRERHMQTMSGLTIFMNVRWDQGQLRWDLFFDPDDFEDSTIESASELFCSVLRLFGDASQDGSPGWRERLAFPPR